MSGNLSRAALEAAKPRATWDMESEYDFIYLLPSRKKHDSGWHLISIVGSNRKGELEQAAFCDDICWHVERGQWTDMRMDMTYPGGVIRCWGDQSTKFRVGRSLSSTDVTVVRINTKEAA